MLDLLDRIQATLDSCGGRSLVLGGDVEVVEGPWPGTIVVIQLPGVDDARAWYQSPGYQAILPLRTNNIAGEAIIVGGVDIGYDPANIAAALRAAASAT